MKRPWLILFAGLALAAAAYFTFYFIGTAHARAHRQSPAPELSWLKTEFHLSDPEFARVCEMHQSYVAGCMGRCLVIDAKNRELKRLLASTNIMTSEIEKALYETAQLRADCQKAMLQHFYEVSRMMPANQGKRYLAWVQEQTILPDSHKEMHH